FRRVLFRSSGACVTVAETMVAWSVKCSSSVREYVVDGVCVFDTTTSYTTSHRPSPTGVAETISLVCVGVPTTVNPAGSQLIVGSTPESSGTSASAHAVLTTASSTAPPLPRSGQPRAWWRVPASRSALAWHAARAARAHGAPLLLVARDTHAAHQLEADLHTLLGRDADLPVVLFPDWETLPWDRFSPHPDIVSQRLATLLRLPSLDRAAVVIVPVQTLLQRLPPL